MAKKKPAVVEKRSKGPYLAAAAGVCFALALLSLFVLIAAGSLTALSGVEKVLRGLGGDLRFALPLAFAWFGALFAGAARGKRLGVLRMMGNVLIVLLFYAAVHMFWADYINENGYHVRAALGYGDLSKSPTTLASAAGRWARCWAALPTCISASGWAFLPCFCCSSAFWRSTAIWAGGCALPARSWRRAASPAARRSAAAREEEADLNFELDRRTMLREDELIRETPRRVRPHAPETPVAGARRRADEPPSPMDAQRRRAPAAASEAPAQAAPRRRARADEPASPMDAPRPRRGSEKSAPAQEAPARAKKRVKTAPRIYNETVEEGQAPAGEEAFGPVVRVGGAVPAAHGKKAEKAVKAEAQAAPEAEKGRLGASGQKRNRRTDHLRRGPDHRAGRIRTAGRRGPLRRAAIGQKAAAQVQEGRPRAGGGRRGCLRLPAHRPACPRQRPRPP